MKFTGRAVLQVALMLLTLLVMFLGVILGTLLTQEISEDKLPGMSAALLFIRNNSGLLVPASLGYGIAYGVLEHKLASTASPRAAIHFHLFFWSLPLLILVATLIAYFTPHVKVITTLSAIQWKF